MDTHLEFDKPTAPLLSNMAQQFSGWLAVSGNVRDEDIRFRIDGRPVNVQLARRPDAERVFSRRYVVGWSFLVAPDVLYDHPRRTLCLDVWAGDRKIYARTYCKSKNLMPETHSSPLFFMHVPKTAGTALRTFIDYAFRDFPILLVYGDAPGIGAAVASTTYLEFTRTREIIFGHIDYTFVRAVREVNPKVVTVVRDPDQLVRSYLSFHPDPRPFFLDNPLVRHFSGNYSIPFGEVSAAHLDEAMRNIEADCYVLQQARLQEFADEVTGMFGMPRYAMTRVNETPVSAGVKRLDLPIDLRYDRQLFAACRERKDDFVSFLNR